MTVHDTQEFKDAMVSKMLGPNALSATALSHQAGVSQTSLSKWTRHALDHGVPVTSSFDSLTPARQLDLLIQARALPQAELGAFLRTHGLHEADLDTWTRQLLDACDPALSRRREREHAAQLAAHAKREQVLHRELARKDRALAEAAALLILQKKSTCSGGTRSTSVPRV